ncbi:MAG TPA: acyl-CoA dehydrogenase family protein [Fimbriimonadaceae bacterium]|nr:acyl-CoA dehydrogenase family protein [Fimbriimonadaceae bacterium]
MTLYRLDPAQQALLDRLGVLADAEIAPHAADVDDAGRFPSESMDALARDGFYGLTVPTEYGGLGQSLRVAAAAVDTIAQRCSSTAMVYLMHLCGVAAYNSNPAVSADQLRASAAGRHLATLAWSERGSRSHFWAPVSQEIEDGDDVILNGIKSWVTSAGYANGYVTTTRLAGSDNPMAISLYMVLDTDPGFEIEGPWNAMGMRGNASAPMVLKEARVAKGRSLSERGKAMDTMMGAVLPMFSLGNAACSIGTSEAAVQSTQRHLVNSKFAHLGQSLADLPNLRERLARMRICTDQARAYLAATLDAIESPHPGTMLMVLGAKAQAAEAAIEITDLGMRACGGAAFSKHLGLERQFRDARAMSVMAPTSDVLHDFVGKALCGMELFS